jgi:hypothetical protein
MPPARPVEVRVSTLAEVVALPYPVRSCNELHLFNEPKLQMLRRCPSAADCIELM